MKKSIVAFAFLYAITPVLIKMSEDFHDVGAAKLMDYKWGDWFILGFSAAAFSASNLLAFFSTKWSDYKKDKEKPLPSPPEQTKTDTP